VNLDILNLLFSLVSFKGSCPPAAVGAPANSLLFPT
jgi:hypothetical protein